MKANNVWWLINRDGFSRFVAFILLEYVSFSIKSFTAGDNI